LAPVAPLHHVTGSNSALKSISNPPATHVKGSLMVLMAEIPVPSVPSVPLVPGAPVLPVGPGAPLVPAAPVSPFRP
jgi:hypothetical protein